LSEKGIDDTPNYSITLTVQSKLDLNLFLFLANESLFYR
jgi:hypothetical protein